MVLVLGNARLEMERELAEGKKQNLGVLVIKAFSSEAAVARFAAGHRLDRWLRRSLQVLRGREYAAVTAQPAPNFSTSIATDLDIAVIDFFIVKSVR